MSKIDTNKQKKRDSLLNASFDFFMTKGLEKTSISDIIEKAGVAKGTFYLYFKDKYDIRNKLVIHKSAQLFSSAYEALQNTDIDNIQDKIIFVVDHIIEELSDNKALLSFLHKDLTWGIFRRMLDMGSPFSEEIDVSGIYKRLLEQSGVVFVEPDIMLFMIMELAGSTSYSAIVDGIPCSIEELKPYLYRSIKDIINNHIQ